jgi:hypothetical protein
MAMIAEPAIKIAIHRAIIVALSTFLMEIKEIRHQSFSILAFSLRIGNR